MKQLSLFADGCRVKAEVFTGRMQVVEVVHNVFFSLPAVEGIGAGSVARYAVASPKIVVQGCGQVFAAVKVKYRNATAAASPLLNERSAPPCTRHAHLAYRLIHSYYNTVNRKCRVLSVRRSHK